VLNDQGFLLIKVWWQLRAKLSASCSERCMRWRQFGHEVRRGVVEHDRDIHQRRQRDGVGILEVENGPNSGSIVGRISDARTGLLVKVLD
jgi:hypothetical protein